MNLNQEHIGFAVTDLEKSLDFYEKLGFKKHFALNDADGKLRFVYLKSQDIFFFLELLPFDIQYRADRKSRHICLEVDDAEESARELQQCGIDVYYGPACDGCRAPIPYINKDSQSDFHVFFVEDPDGNQIEIMEGVNEND